MKLQASATPARQHIAAIRRCELPPVKTTVQPFEVVDVGLEDGVDACIRVASNVDLHSTTVACTFFTTTQELHKLSTRPQV